MSAKNGFDPLRKALGEGFIKRLNENPDDCPLKFGSVAYTTHQLATELGVIHRAAARYLSLAADSIGARTVNDLYRRSTPYTFASVPRFGETMCYVAWRLFEKNGLDPVKWYGKGQQDAIVAFRSLKHRAQKRGDLMSEEAYERKLKLARIRRHR